MVSEFDFLFAGGQTEDERLWLFDMASHNRSQQEARRRSSLYFSAVTH